MEEERDAISQKRIEQGRERERERGRQIKEGQIEKEGKCKLIRLGRCRKK
jgi:hypothetical protein